MPGSGALLPFRRDGGHGWHMYRGNEMLLDEVLYMEVRIFRQFLERFKMKASDAYSIFEDYDIWGYIESCYDVLHMNGDECVLNDVQQILSKNGAIPCSWIKNI